MALNNSSNFESLPSWYRSEAEKYGNAIFNSGITCNLVSILMYLRFSSCGSDNFVAEACEFMLSGSSSKGCGFETCVFSKLKHLYQIMQQNGHRLGFGFRASLRALSLF